MKTIQMKEEKSYYLFIAEISVYTENPIKSKKMD